MDRQDACGNRWRRSALLGAVRWLLRRVLHALAVAPHQAAAAAAAGARARHRRRCPPAPYPQYWKRNTLLVDLSAASGAGSIAAQAGRRPRLAGAARVARHAGRDRRAGGARRAARDPADHARGGKPVDLELPPGRLHADDRRRSTVSLGSGGRAAASVAADALIAAARRRSPAGAPRPDSTAVSAPPQTQPVSSPTTPCALHQPERRPVAEDDARVAAGAVRGARTTGAAARAAAAACPSC